MATHTPGISAVQLQRQLGISRYETAWLMLHKLRRAMVAPEREPLGGEVEIDETLVGGRHEGRRGGRQRDGRALVAVAVEVRGSGSGRLRLQVLADASQATLTPWVQTIVAPGATVATVVPDALGSTPKHTSIRAGPHSRYGRSVRQMLEPRRSLRRRTTASKPCQLGLWTSHSAGEHRG